MEKLKLKLQQELNSTIKSGISPKLIKDIQKSTVSILDSSIVEHIKRSRLNNVYKNDEVKIKDEEDKKIVELARIRKSRLSIVNNKNEMKNLSEIDEIKSKEKRRNNFTNIKGKQV